MSSLADASDLVGFFSYSRADDEGSKGKLSTLREFIQEQLRSQLGRTKEDFRLWQDKAALLHGEVWEKKIKSAIAEAVFFIPIITPTAIRSRECKFEFDLFLAREKELGRDNLIFPILYIPVPALADDRSRELLSIIRSRQYEDLQDLRHLDPYSSEPLALRVQTFCANICRALLQDWLSLEERREAEARRVAEEEHRRQKKLQEEARQRAEEERRRQEAEIKQRAEEQERRRKAKAEERRRDEDEQRRRHGRRQTALSFNELVNVVKAFFLRKGYGAERNVFLYPIPDTITNDAKVLFSISHTEKIVAVLTSKSSDDTIVFTESAIHFRAKMLLLREKKYVVSYEKLRECEPRSTMTTSGVIFAETKIATMPYLEVPRRDVMELLGAIRERLNERGK